MPIYASMYDEHFNLCAGDTIQISQKKDGICKILYEHKSTRTERVRIRLDRDTEYPGIDEDDGA